ncbi:hypothetical protein AGMMS50268_04050 [Spirochaetia bacterium]|nr:hypothetical protein AGMMS50268_04050 [Spirochaetia bacterium]
MKRGQQKQVSVPDYCVSVMNEICGKKLHREYALKMADRDRKRLNKKIREMQIILETIKETRRA